MSGGENFVGYNQKGRYRRKNRHERGGKKKKKDNKKVSFKADYILRNVKDRRDKPSSMPRKEKKNSRGGERKKRNDTNTRSGGKGESQKIKHLLSKFFSGFFGGAEKSGRRRGTI